MGQCVSVVLRAAELMTHPKQNDHQAVDDLQDGPDRPVQRNNVENCSLHAVLDSAVTLTTAALSSQFSPIDFPLPSFCPFVWFRSVQPGVEDEDRHRSATATLPYCTFQSTYNNPHRISTSSIFKHSDL